MNTPMDPWLTRLDEQLPELLELRRHLHAHPELSGEEHQTAALVAGAKAKAAARRSEVMSLDFIFFSVFCERDATRSALPDFGGGAWKIVLQLTLSPREQVFPRRCKKIRLTADLQNPQI